MSDDGVLPVRVQLRCGLCSRLLSYVEFWQAEGWCEVLRDLPPDGTDVELSPLGPRRASRVTLVNEHQLSGRVALTEERGFAASQDNRYRFTCDSRRHRGGARLDRVVTDQRLLALSRAAVAARPQRPEILL